MGKTKICKKCGEEKDITLFVKHKECKDGYTNTCKECSHKINKQYKKEHQEEIKEYSKKYRKEHQEYYQKYNKEYGEKYKKEHKEYFQKYNKEYYKNNPHLFLNYNSQRRNKEENQGGGITKEQWLEMMKFFDWKCAYSDIYIGGDNKDDRRTIDHIFCINNGGLNEIWNIVPMLKSYNSSKKNKNPLEWYKKQDFYSEENINKIIEWQIYAYNKWATEDDENLILIIDIMEEKNYEEKR